MIAMMQFQNQLDEVERPTPLERIGRGKISPITTQAQGPQVVANMKMLMQMKAIMADTADRLLLPSGFSLPAVAPIIPTMYCAMTIPIPPKIRRLRRPIRSTIQKESGVEQTLTRVVMREIRNGFEIVPKLHES